MTQYGIIFNEKQTENISKIISVLKIKLNKAYALNSPTLTLDRLSLLFDQAFPCEQCSKRDSTIVDNQIKTPTIKPLA